MLNVEEIREFCLHKKHVEESFPFGDDTLVFKTGGKIFLLVSLDSEQLQFNVKCKPSEAIQLREQYSSVLPGYHMNKSHWNTILCNNSISKQILLGWITDSYLLVVDSLPKKLRDKYSS